MKIFSIIFISLFMLTACSDQPSKLKHFTSPHGGTYALRLPDQVQVTENSFIYEIKIENLENDYFEIKRYKFERMNFHPFTPVFAKHQLEFLHFEYFTMPLDQRDKAYEYLTDWDQKINNNPTLFKVTNKLTFAVCKTQPIATDKLVTTIFSRMNKPDEFNKIYDDLLRETNKTTPVIAYQEIC